MLPNPCLQFRSTDQTGRDTKHYSFGAIDRSFKIKAVETQKGLQCGVPDALVAIEERVVPDK